MISEGPSGLKVNVKTMLKDFKGKAADLRASQLKRRKWWAKSGQPGWRLLSYERIEYIISIEKGFPYTPNVAHEALVEKGMNRQHATMFVNNPTVRAIMSDDE